MKHIDKTAIEKPLHVAYQPRHLKPDTRLGADAPDFKQLFHEMFADNPFRRVGR